ncbi:MAG: hypothetical protein ABII74_00895 [Elusimicrobiota bacterium]
MKKNPKIRRDNRGEFIYDIYFMNGKMKKKKIYVVDGTPAEEFYEQNADPNTLLQNGDYELLYEQEINSDNTN